MKLQMQAIPTGCSPAQAPIRKRVEAFVGALLIAFAAHASFFLVCAVVVSPTFPWPEPAVVVDRNDSPGEGLCLVGLPHGTPASSLRFPPQTPPPPVPMPEPDILLGFKAWKDEPPAIGHYFGMSFGPGGGAGSPWFRWQPVERP